MGSPRKRTAKRGNRRVRKPATVRTRNRSRRRAEPFLRRLTPGLLALGTVALVAFLVARGFGGIRRSLLTENPRFTLREIDIAGLVTIPRDRLLRETGISPGRNLMALDLAAIRRRLQEIPNVAEATVRREMPDRLLISVRERLPVARIGTENGALLAGDGMVLDPDLWRRPGGGDRVFRMLPVIAGVPGGPFRPGERVPGEWVGPALEVLRYLQRERLGDIVRVECIDLAARHGLTLYLSGGETVLMEPEGVDLQLRRLEVILDGSWNRGRRVATVDLTSGRNVPVTYRNGA